MKNIANINLILVLLILSVLGCVCPNSSQRNSLTNNTANQNANTNTTTVTPSASPSLSPTPSTTDLDSPEALERIKKGEAIYQRISSRTGLPVMFGWRGKDITIPVPMSDWNGMSKAEQVDLTYYAEHLVQEIKDNPVSYTTRWASYYKRTEKLEDGGEYDGLYQFSYNDQVRNLCRTCWSITIGKAKRNGFYDESTPVSGGTVQEFRASEQKTVEKTSTEKDADGLKTFAASMSASEHLIAAKEALDSNYDPTQEHWGNTVLARKHIITITKNAPEYSDAQKLLQQVIKRERERKQFQDDVVREVKRLSGAK